MLLSLLACAEVSGIDSVKPASLHTVRISQYISKKILAVRMLWGGGAIPGKAVSNLMVCSVQ